MSEELTGLINKKVLVLCNDGKGILRGFDQATNLILEETIERYFSMDQDVQEMAMGINIIRGDDIAIVGEYSKEMDEASGIPYLRGEPLKPIVH